MRRGASGLCGVLAIDKPGGMTSHDVVNRVRHLTGERRVGHAGTLDPMATGLLFVAVGAATRLSNYLSGHDKSYRARIVFGAATDTDDAEGRIVSYNGTCGGADPREALGGLDPQGELDSLVGPCDQMPPAYSAIKKNGTVAYKAAREGRALELEPRRVQIHGARLVGRGETTEALADGEGGTVEKELPYWDVDLHVSKGTYIRSIARDLGVALGCGAHLGALRRTAVAGFPVERAVSLDELAGLAASGDALPWTNPAELLGFPVLHLDEEQAADVRNGRRLSWDKARGAAHVSCVAGKRLLAVYESDAGALKPATVIPGGVVGVAS